MQNHDATAQIQHDVKQAITNRQPLNIRAGGSKGFIGTIDKNAEILDIASHQGIVSYEPTELVITARAGTPLSDIESTLAAHGQKLAFEPPQYTQAATIGGTVATAISGPARPYLGAVRDHVLGCRIINGHAHTLRFGGEVMKNVAGYDVTRLMTGAMGTLGVLLDVSLKVVPIAEHEITLCQNMDIHGALKHMQQLAGDSPLVSASAWHDGYLYIRLAGVSSAVHASADSFGGEPAEASIWTELRDHQHNFFSNDAPLWRISVPPLAPELDLEGAVFYDWAGTQRWLYSTTDAKTIRDAATRVKGHAQLFKADTAEKQLAGVFHPLTERVMALHTNIKNEFDPHGLFNPGRLYQGF